MFKFFLIAALVACVVAESEDHHAETISEKREIDHDSWSSEFETTNHIRQAAHGDKHAVVGDFSWIAPHGEKVDIKYVADENGYQPEGDVIPKIPVEILKSLEYIRSHPAYVEEDSHHH